uniref:growth hormone secretagogue receptor type 1-like n=1 Tax=Styela clava TaxID=7725 RepID=UPI0019394482|nr:growth hormone secretagogue receptor type 1-like [Styela clava]
MEFSAAVYRNAGSGVITPNITSLTTLVTTITVNFSENVLHGHPASHNAQIVITVLIAVLGLWSTIGNLLTILAISMHRNMRTKCNFFIFSLAISDLLSGAIASPLWLYRRTWGFQQWMWGEFPCKLFWFVDESTSYCTAMHIASFAVWRFMGVRWPHVLEKLEKWSVKIWLGVIWVIALVFGGAIFCTFYSVEDRSHMSLESDFARWPACSIKTEDGGVTKHLIYYTFSSACFMLLPMLILFMSSIFIIRELLWYSKVKTSSRKSKERKAVWQLALIAASFLVGYIPMTIYVMWTTRTKHGDYRLDYWIHVGAYFCLRMSECFNPIIYNIASASMRKASKRTIHFIRNCCRSDAELDFISHSPACNHKRLIRKNPHKFNIHQYNGRHHHHNKQNNQIGDSKKAYLSSTPNSPAFVFPQRTVNKEVNGHTTKVFKRFRLAKGASETEEFIHKGADDMSMMSTTSAKVCSPV